MTQKNALLVYPAFATSFWSLNSPSNIWGKNLLCPP